MSMPRAVLVSLALLLSACSGLGAPSPTLDGAWLLHEGTSGGAPLDLGRADVTLEVNGHEVSGRSGCNLYSGTLSVDATGGVSFGRLGGTEMGCDRDVMDLEAAYLAALATMGRASQSSGVLTLTGKNDRLVFRRVAAESAAPFVATSWRLESVVEGEVASSVVAGADAATLVFDEDGRWQASTGCRTVTGRYDGTMPALTLMLDPYDTFGCSPAAMEQQDELVLGILDGEVRATIDGRQLTLAGRDDRALVYREAPR
jgi:heat shock protein HslJ